MGVNLPCRVWQCVAYGKINVCPYTYILLGFKQGFCLIKYSCYCSLANYYKKRRFSFFLSFFLDKARTLNRFFIKMSAIATINQLLLPTNRGKNSIHLQVFSVRFLYFGSLIRKFQRTQRRQQDRAQRSVAHVPCWTVRPPSPRAEQALRSKANNIEDNLSPRLSRRKIVVHRSRIEHRTRARKRTIEARRQQHLRHLANEMITTEIERLTHLIQLLTLSPDMEREVERLTHQLKFLTLLSPRLSSRSLPR